MDKDLKPYTHDDLWKCYTDGEEVDSEVFAEMRSNIRLVNGDHYSRKRLTVTRIIQDAEDLTESQKIRITKNHIQKICQLYEDTVLSSAPGVGFEAHNKSELQDQKSAELHHAVWKDAEENFNFKEMEESLVEDFVEIGEVHAKCLYDPNEGPIIGYRPMVDESGVEDPNTPDMMKPVFKGEIVIEDLEGYNLVRPIEAKRIDKAEWLAYRKMVSMDALKQKFPDKQNLFSNSNDQTYVVFDSSTGGYRKSDKECFVVEMYFRPCPRYPQGYVCFMTRDGIFYEDELPGGIFPIISKPCNRIKGSPRGRSPIKTMRPFQIEINRCASKMAEHHTTVGDDKIILLNGSKASPGIAQSGIRTINVSGAAPEILAGRDGSQYLATAQSNVSELYTVMNVPEEAAEQPNSATDAYVLLYRSASQKAVHNRRIRRYSDFKRNLVKTYLKIAKLYLSDDIFIKAVGKNEQVNITEFKNSNDMGYEVNVTDQSDDIETKLGQQIMYSQVLQYIGNKLTPDQIGMILRLMPYANGELATQDLTASYDKATNEILALDRGQTPPVHPYDDHKYMIKKLTSRISQPDFDFLNPQIQQNYEAKLDIHMQFDAHNEQMLRMKEQGFIPTTGYLVVCDLYVPKPDNPTATQRVRVPSDALQYLIKMLELQGTQVEADANLPETAQAQVAQKVMQPPQQLKQVS